MAPVERSGDGALDNVRRSDKFYSSDDPKRGAASLCHRAPNSSVNPAPHLFRSNRHVDMGYAIGRQRIDDRINNRRRRANRSRFAYTLDAKWIHRRGRLGPISLKPWHLRSLRQCIIHQFTGDELSLFVINDLFVKRLADRLHNAAVHLTVYEQRVDNFAAIIDRDVLHDFRIASVLIDLDNADVRTKREGEVLWLEKGSCGQR